MRCCICLTTCRPPLPLCHVCQSLLPRTSDGGSQGGRAVGEIWVPFRYEFPLTLWIHQYKYQGQPGMASWLSRLLADNIAPSVQVDMLIPIPIHPSRQRVRGFNQSALLARQLATLMGKPCGDILVKNRVTPSQRGLDRWQRKRNLAGSFGMGSSQKEAAGRHILLVDDVVTTGSTAEEAADALLGAGAARVSLAALAKAGTAGATI